MRSGAAPDRFVAVLGQRPQRARVGVAVPGHDAPHSHRPPSRSVEGVGAAGRVPSPSTTALASRWRGTAEWSNPLTGQAATPAMSGCGSYRPGLPPNIPPRSLEGGIAARSCSDSPHPPVLHARPEVHDNPAECAHAPRAGRLSSIDRSCSDDTPDAAATASRGDIAANRAARAARATGRDAMRRIVVQIC